MTGLLFKINKWRTLPIIQWDAHVVGVVVREDRGQARLSSIDTHQATGDPGRDGEFGGK
jgi:hypothetical protein